MLRQKFEKLRALYRTGGAAALVKYLGAALLTSVCDYQVQELRGRARADSEGSSPPVKSDGDGGTDWLFLEPGESLEPFAAEFSQPFRDSFDGLQQRLAEGCALVLARRPAAGGTGRVVVGYTIMEVGGFSAAGVKGKISKDILFVHYTEVTPSYRGQRIAQVLARTHGEYCAKHGIKKSCTAHTPGNTTSERAFRVNRVSSNRLLCRVARVSLFRGLFVWHTPWEKIERAIAQLDDGSKFDVRGAKAEFGVGKKVKV